MNEGRIYTLYTFLLKYGCKVVKQIVDPYDGSIHITLESKYGNQFVVALTPAGKDDE